MRQVLAAYENTRGMKLIKILISNKYVSNKDLLYNAAHKTQAWESLSHTKISGLLIRKDHINV